MGELVVIKEATVRGYYEEPIWDNAPSYTYTTDVVHKVHPGDVCYIDDNGRISHDSDQYGVSVYAGTLWLCPTETEMESVFGQLTMDVAEPWHQLLKEKSRTEKSLDALKSELLSLEMKLEYNLDAKNEDASMDDAWQALTEKNQLEYEYMCLEYRYSGICMSLQLLANALPCYCH